MAYGIDDTREIAAEKAVLGSMLLDRRAAAIGFCEITADDFGEKRHRDIFNAMLKQRDNGGDIDLIVLLDTLERDAKLSKDASHKCTVYVSELSGVAASSWNIRQYIRITRKARDRRALDAALGKIKQKLVDRDDDALEFAQKAIYDITARQDRAEVKPIGADALNVLVEYASENGKNNIPTRIYDLDDLMNGGMRRKSLIILAARPSMGKTTLAMNIASNVADCGKTVYVFSLEQPKEDLILRMISARAGVELRDVRNSDVASQVMEDACEACEGIAKQLIFINDKPRMTVQDIRTELMLHKLRNPLDLVIVDYLQIMRYRGKAENRTLQIGDITGQFAAIAKDFDVPVLLLSQLSRDIEKRQDKTPTLADLRDSGAIEQDADVVWMLNCPNEYDKTEDEHDMELYDRKNRNGRTGMVGLHWERKHFKITSKEWRE